MHQKVYVVEDMAVTRASIISTLEQNDVHVLGSSANAEQAWKEIQELSPDLVLIDINLAGEKDGLWLASKIKASFHIGILFLTAYGDRDTLEKIKHAKADGYIQKPFKTPTLLANIGIVIQNLALKPSRVEAEKQNEIIIKSGGKQVFLDPSDIRFVRSDGNYLEIICSKKREITRMKIGDFLQELPSGQFIQVHRRYLVNKSKINAMNNNTIWMDDEKIPISESFKKETQEILKGEKIQ